jgi:ring-1,2-phenylacetyl-CoA epoxidase subunit PaaC
MTNSMTAEFETTDGMGPECLQGLRHLLMACADTKLLLGYHYGEWTFGTPELEAAVASCSLAQAELGHVRLLHAVLSKHFGDDPDTLVEERANDAYANIAFLDRPIEDWAGFVAANYVVDHAVTRTLHALQGSSFKPLRMSVEKMLDEERYHLHHGRGWFRTLAGRVDQREALLARVHDALGAVGAWFGPAHEPGDAALVAAGVKTDANATLYQAVVTEVTELAGSLDLRIDVDPPAGFDAWTPDNRRMAGGGPDDEILFHLRGTKNEIFKLA